MPPPGVRLAAHNRLVCISSMKFAELNMVLFDGHTCQPSRRPTIRVA